MPRPPSSALRPPPTEADGAATVLVLTDDTVLARHLLSVVAAVGLAPEEPASEDGLRRSWRAAGAVLVGRDRAESVHGLGLPPRAEVYVIGRDDDRAATTAWSTRLRAAVATLPGGAPDLAGALSVLVDEAALGAVVALVGGSGGVGTSTLAAALSLAAAREGRRVLLVDADPTGGGIDVLLGAERLAGWRWSRLAAARGHVGDLTGQLVHCDGVDVLAADRGLDPSAGLQAAQVAAVVDSAARSHDLVVVDLPRHLGPAHPEVLRRAGTVLLLARGDVRGVAAAGHLAAALAPGCRDLQVLVRTGRGCALDPVLVADALDLPLGGVVEEEHALAGAAERGEPPGRSARSALVRLCERLLLARSEASA